MALSLSFRFADDDLNEKLIQRVRKARIKHTVGDAGDIRYSSADEGVVENDLISTIRDEVFSPWQVLTCPADSQELYRRYMARHDIPYCEEWSDGDLWFLLPAKYRPHRWKLTAKKARLKVRVR
jgi:hypothetical protein